VAALESCLRANDLGGVERAAHRLRGSLTSLSARPASDAALLTEQAARDGRRSHAEESLATLVQEIAYLSDALTDYQAKAVR
jgi:HPt (histidine-containing phosphotransfer) domain-containing protein